MVVLAAVILFAAVVVFLSRRANRSRVRLAHCCSARPWPPDDLTGEGTPRR
jgi:hypothetical protein